MVNLSRFNTLRLPCKANDLITVSSVRQVKHLPKDRLLFLGLGANILFRSDFPGTVIKNDLHGRRILRETDDSVDLELGSGENWHQSVMWSVENNWSGIENMALIPGTVGAAAVGNIAAYGQNQEDSFQNLTAIEVHTGQPRVFSKTDMRFGYRESILKNELSGRYFVTSVTIRLSKTAHLQADYHSRYESLKGELAKISPPPYSPATVARAVINLRNIKQPDWTKIGTAGSFFKNPITDVKTLRRLKSSVSELQFYPEEKLSYEIKNWEIPADLSDSARVKIPAGRLLDELGWRGKKIGHVGTFDKHALVIITYPGATGSEVYEFSESMRSDVRKNFGLDLEYEVVLV